MIAILVEFVLGRPAQAGPLSASALFGQFNAIIFDNFSASSEVEGRTVVGGNLTNGSNFETRTGLQASAFGALSVYGTVTATGMLNVDNGGSIAIAGSNAASFNLNNGGSAYVGGSNTGSLAVSGGSGSVSVIGANAGALSLSNGGSVYVGSGNTGPITVSGGSPTRLSINGNSSNTIALNNAAALSLNGSNNGTIQLNGGTFTYSGNAGSVTNVNGGTQTHQSPLSLTAPTSTLGNFVTTFQAPLTALSTQLNGVTPNSTATSSGGAITFNAAPNSSGVAVFDVNTSLFSGASSVAINLDGATSVIINVNVDSCVSNACLFSPGNLNFTGGTSYASAVLWNFVNASALNLTSEFVGSILAPNATVTNSNAIDGTLVALNDSGSTGEIHSYAYTGTFPGSPTAAPEPATLGLVGVGFAALAGVRSRRKRQASLPRTAADPQ